MKSLIWKQYDLTWFLHSAVFLFPSVLVFVLRFSPSPHTLDWQQGPQAILVELQIIPVICFRCVSSATWPAGVSFHLGWECCVTPNPPPSLLVSVHNKTHVCISVHDPQIFLLCSRSHAMLVRSSFFFEAHDLFLNFFIYCKFRLFEGEKG